MRTSEAGTRCRPAVGREYVTVTVGPDTYEDVPLPLTAQTQGLDGSLLTEVVICMREGEQGFITMDSLQATRSTIHLKTIHSDEQVRVMDVHVGTKRVVCRGAGAVCSEGCYVDLTVGVDHLSSYVGGEGTYSELVACALLGMREGDVCDVSTTDDAKKNSTRVALTAIRTTPEPVTDMDASKILETIALVQNEAKKAHARGHYVFALHLYNSALSKCKYGAGVEEGEADSKGFQQAEEVICSNASQCCLALHDGARALFYADEALSLNPNCLKARYRHAMANLIRGEPLSAKEDLLQSRDRGLWTPEFEALRQRVAGALAEEKLRSDTLLRKMCAGVSCDDA